MKKNILILLVIILGIFVLFFFPEPETNFFAYIATALFFVGIVILLKVKLKNQ